MLIIIELLILMILVAMCIYTAFRYGEAKGQVTILERVMAYLDTVDLEGKIDDREVLLNVLKAITGTYEE